LRWQKLQTMRAAGAGFILFPPFIGESGAGSSLKSIGGAGAGRLGRKPCCPALSLFFNLKSEINMPNYTPLTGGGAVLVRQNPAPLAHAGSFLGLALDQSDSMESLAGVAVESVNRLVEEQKALSGSSRFSLLLFNSKVETIRDATAVRISAPGWITVSAMRRYRSQ
jgi:hypothetical protein